MPISSKDFTVIGANSTDLAKLDHALLYIQSNMPTYGAPALAQAVQKGLIIAVNYRGENTYDSDARLIHWDPTKALVVENTDGTAKGVNSAASVLLHEIMHATDPNYLKNNNTRDAQYDWVSERVATENTAQAVAEAGEVARENHRGELIVAPNVTEHTGHIDGFAFPRWVEVDLTMEIDIGPLVNLGNIGSVAPTIGGGGGIPKDDDKHVKKSGIELGVDAYIEIGLVGNQSELDVLYLA